MPNVMAALPNIGGALCSTPQSWLTPTTRVPCSNAAKTPNALKFAGVPQTNERISAASGPKFTILWGHVGEILLLNKFFPIVDTCLSCKDIAGQSCAMVHRWRFLATFWVLHLQRAACSTFQTCILNSHYGHAMCKSMADIQSVAAERRGKKEEEDRRMIGTLIKRTYACRVALSTKLLTQSGSQFS